MNIQHDHFHREVSDELRKYVDEVALADSRYMFVQSSMRIQYGYCTHCNQRMITEGLRQGKLVNCLVCESLCIVKATGRGRKRLIDEACVVWYGKSKLDPSIVTAVCYYVTRDFRGDYQDVETKYMVCAKYLFNPGNIHSKGKDRFGTSAMLRKDYSGQWFEPKSILSFRENHLQRMSLYVKYENVREAVKGTPLQYCQWEDLHDHYEEDCYEWRGLTSCKRKADSSTSDIVRFFDVATRYPCTEYLMKIGYEDFVKRKFMRQSLHNTINWRGKTLPEVMRMTKTELKQLLARTEMATPGLLRAYHWFRKKGIMMSFDESNLLQSFPEGTTDQLLRKIGVSIEDAAKYLLKQFRRSGSKKTYSSDYMMLRDWDDYLADCRKLEMDVESSAVKYPNDLHAAHQKTMKKVKYKADKQLSDKIESLFHKLMDDFYFETESLIVRPIKTASEIFAEAKALSHCVGGYANRHAAGEVTILVVRQKEKPDTPYYTIEIADRTIRQCRGYKNCAMTDDVDRFVRAFASTKLKKKPDKNMRGVAV